MDGFTLTNQSHAVYDVVAEREKQIMLGWTREHDLEHSTEDLVQAAGSYLMRPWDLRTNMVKAAALLIAAIERYDSTTQSG